MYGFFDGIVGYITDIVYAFDYAISYIYWVILQPFDVALGYIFSGFDTTWFVTLIYNTNAEIPHLYVPVISEAVRFLFEGMYGWVDELFPQILFGGI